MPNINIEIPPELHHKLKLNAVMDNKTLKELIIEALKEKNGRKNAHNKTRTIRRK